MMTLSLAAGCDNNPGKDKARATVGEAASVVRPALDAEGYTFSQDGSKIEFVGAKVTGKHDGSFAVFSGRVNLVQGAPERSSVEVEMEMNSITTDAEKLTAHLKSADFFDVVRYPKAHFSSTSVKVGREKGATHTVTGNLEMHGVTKSISFPCKIRVSGDSVEVDAEFTVNRKDFGLVYPGKPDDLIRDDVVVKLAVRAKRT
jgi:polyisoprenoid-binding protein YceI